MANLLSNCGRDQWLWRSHAPHSAAVVYRVIVSTSPPLHTVHGLSGVTRHSRARSLFPSPAIFFSFPLPLPPPPITAVESGERYSSPVVSGGARPPNAFLYNSQPKICRSVKSFTHVQKTPIHFLSWECCNKTLQCLISGWPNVTVTVKLFLWLFLPGTRVHLHSGGSWTLPTLLTPLLRHCIVVEFELFELYSLLELYELCLKITKFINSRMQLLARITTNIL